MLAVHSHYLRREEQSYVNPFSIASISRDSDNSQGEFTAEGFFKNPEDSGKSPMTAVRE